MFGMITLDDFKKVEMKVGKVLAAERVDDSEKLLKLRVDIGSEKRQIIAGIGSYYAPEELMGRNIIVVVNLEPRMLMGLESQGMLLAASCEGEISIIIPDKDVAPGSIIR
ncbi:MAG: methionine--tRNA ligase subunit beta [Candidatus Sungbacteria bacterium]|nr:methionine--tRNA ligase subunit beta [Candidatus Sungbacteria bacterium]